METVLMTDSSCDMPRKFIEENNIQFLGLTCFYKGKAYEDDFGKTLTYKEFYDGMRHGEMPYTSQINVYRFAEVFEKFAKEKKSVIYIGFDSAISGTVQSAATAKNEVLEKYPDADITVIDTKSACVGQGLLVYYACEMLKNGASKDEIINFINQNMLKVNHWFMVEDLFHLKRGGRISATKAYMGSILNIKPIIFINDKGELINVTNIRGRNRGMKYLVDMFREKAVPHEQAITISHGDCEEDALALKDMLTSEFNIKKVIINPVGLVLGSHVGPGMLSLCFLGKDRSY